MIYYRAFCNTPEEARKPITAGRLKNFTDINPMWRFKALTETFGPCGIGWYYTIEKQELVNGADGEVKAFVDIRLYYKHEGEWSMGIPGTGGSSFVSNEKGGKYNNDECFKMALTDAIGTACKALGMSADIYFQKDRTKYTNLDNSEKTVANPKQEAKPVTYECEMCHKPITPVKDAKGRLIPIPKWVNGTMEKFGHKLCHECIEFFMKPNETE